jgi:hypothetical protein
MDLPQRKGFITTRSVSFEVALFEDRLKKSCSCSMKWCSLSYSKDRIRARAPSSTEQEHEHEKPKNDASRIPECATSKLTLRARIKQQAVDEFRYPSSQFSLAFPRVLTDAAICSRCSAFASLILTLHSWHRFAVA